MITILILNWISIILVVIGAFNWGLIGILNWNLVEAIFGVGYNGFNATVYILVFVASLWLIASLIIGGGNLKLLNNNSKM